MKNDERWLSHNYYVSYMIMQSNITMNAQVIKRKRWKLHGNISRNGNGKAIIGRYGGYFEEDIEGICPRGNNKVVIYISLYHDKCLLFMLELY